MSTTSHMDAAAFVASLAIAHPSAELVQLTGQRGLAGVETAADAPSANVDAGSLVAFTADVSDQHKSDALNSTLLSQMHADTVANRFDPTQVMAWYGAYTTVLEKVGWDMQDFQFQNYQASGSTFSIDSAITSIVTAFLPASEVAVVQATLNALSSLGSDDPWYKVWDSSSHSANGGNFQIATATDNAGGVNTLVMKTSAYAFSTTDTTTRFLWTDYNSSDTELHYSTQTATLDEDVYAQVRDQVIAKLGNNASVFIGGLSI